MVSNRPRKRTLLGNSNDTNNVDMMDADTNDDDAGTETADSGDKITLPPSCLNVSRFNIITVL